MEKETFADIVFLLCVVLTELQTAASLKTPTTQILDDILRRLEPLIWKK